MIKATACLHIRRIPLECLQVKEYQARYPAKLATYMALMEDHPDDDPGLIHVTASNTHPGMFAILDGHHKFVAHVMSGRPDALCVVIEEEQVQP